MIEFKLKDVTRFPNAVRYNSWKTSARLHSPDKYFLACNDYIIRINGVEYMEYNDALKKALRKEYFWAQLNGTAI